jgi:alpha-mannosidase
VLAGPANVLELYEDRPVNFDAGDVDPFHLETRRDCPPADAARVVSAGPLRAEIAFEHRIGESSRGLQTVRLDADARRLEFGWEIDWRESHRLLKVRFPVEVHAPNATYEMQFGVAERPTHYTTPYDLARFEVPGHRFADLSEHGFGVALLTDSKYGYSTYGNTMRISLLRAPKSPDESADMGAQAFRYAVYPHAGGWQEGGVVAEALDLNVPMRIEPVTLEPIARVEGGLLLDTVKLAEREDALVLRLYEPHGGRGRARIVLGVEAGSVRYANLLEDPGDEVSFADGTVEIAYRPFEIVTLLVRR